MIVTARQGDTLDLLCWRHLGTTADVTEQAYELNRDLANGGPVLAEGASIVLPDAVPAAALVRETVNLWD